MTSKHLLRFAMLPLLPAALAAQDVQNRDLYFLGGPSFSRTQVIGGTDITLYGSTGYSTASGFGYQVVRKSAVSLWVETNFITVSPAAQTATIPGSISLGEEMGIAGLRLMIPVHERVSLFGAAGGGYGDFNNPDLTSDNPPDLKTHDSWHAVTSLGGGADFRLSRWFSIRVDARDYISGRNLGGIAGRNRFLPLIGLAFHF